MGLEYDLREQHVRDLAERKGFTLGKSGETYWLMNAIGGRDVHGWNKGASLGDLDAVEAYLGEDGG